MQNLKCLTFFLIAINFSHINCSKNKQQRKNYTEIVSDEELQKWSQEIFDVDKTNILSLIHVNYQGRFELFNSTDDLAPEPLLTYKDEITELDTIKYMMMMYDNYERNSSVDEVVTVDEKNEEKFFLNALLNTTVIKKTIELLKSKNLVGNSTDDHFALLNTLWFDLYPRNKGTNATSSGFEHVFLSEIKRKKVTGLHNWIYFGLMEKTGELNYKGWMKRLDLGDKFVILNTKFNMNGYEKHISSLLIGTSPELEIALYTLCFKLRVNRKCQLTYNDTPFNITAYSFVHKKKKLVGSAFVYI